MKIYLLNFIIIIIYSCLITDKKFLVSLISLQLFLILALRDITIGPDLPAYQEMYHYIGSISWNNLLPRLHFFRTAELADLMGIESGYVILNWIIYQLNFSYHGFLVICSLLTILPVGFFIYRYSLNPSLSFLVYISTNLYFYNFGILRQSLAIGFLLLSVPFILKRNFLVSLLFIALAFTFHRVAILWIPIYFLLTIPLNQKNFALLIIGSIILFFCFMTIGPNIISPILSFFGKSYYISFEVVYNNQIILLFLIAILLYFICDIKNLAQEALNNLVIWTFIFTLYFQVICSYTPLARSIPVVLIFNILLIPITIYKNRYKLLFEQKKQLTFSIYIVVACFLFLYMFVQLKNNEYIVPYIFY